jgi:hypothetical protein
VLSRFTRSPHLFSPAMVSVELTFTNLGTEELKDIRVSQKVSFLTPLFHYCIQHILRILFVDSLLAGLTFCFIRKM